MHHAPCYTLLMLTIALYILSLIIILSYTTFIFFLAQYKKDNSIIDIAYGIGFIVTAYLLIELFPGTLTVSPHTYILFFLIALWGTRLSTRIYLKNRNKGEDFRYATWRKAWNRKGNLYYLARSYLQIFILQGFVISIVLLPFTISLSRHLTVTSGILFGLALWVIGFLFESIGDRQLDRFIKNKAHHKGLIMKTGLWKYTRHPNYFGEATMWFGIASIAYVATGSLFVFLSPLLITYLLLYVSGVPMLEKRWDEDPVARDEWLAYKQKTSMFFPLPPKK